MKQILVPVLLSAFLGPGAGQLYNRNYKKGFLLITTVLLGLIGILVAFVMIAREEILTNPQELFTPGYETILAQKILKEHPLPIQTFKWGFVLLWCYSIVEAYVTAQKKRPRSVSAAQMREIDKRSETDFGVTSLSLMENAGKAVAQEILKIISRNCLGTNPLIVIFCGKGNNGGDGIAVARNLHKANIAIQTFYIESLGKPQKSEVKTQIERALQENLSLICLKENENLPPAISHSLEKSDLIVDALLGTGSKGEPRGLTKTLIDQIASSKKPVLAIDIPSGLDADTGEASLSSIRAKWTVTLGLAKVGLLKEQAKAYVGELIVVDIGHPEGVRSLFYLGIEKKEIIKQ